jgi:polyhydroxybutyrate depolymerase
MNRSVKVAIGLLALGECVVLGLVATSSRKPAPASAPSSSASPLVRERPFDLEVPARYDSTTPAPLLVALHGYGANGDDLAGSRWPLSAIAEAHGVFVAHPNGTPDRSKRRFWEATDACCGFAAPRVDDVAYLMAVIDDVSGRYRIDPKRIWIMGISNGGFMAHRLACDRADKIAAIVSVAGSTWMDPTRCAQSTPVSVLEVHGSDDPIVKYEGGVRVVDDTATAYPSVEATVAQSAANDGCTGALGAPNPVIGFDGEGALPTEIARWSGCPAGIDVERWNMRGARHIPRLTRAWAEAVLAWLEKHPKPSRD